MKQLNSSANVNRRPIIVLATVLVVAVTMFTVWLASSGAADGSKRDYISQVDNLQVLSQQLARFSKEAVEGEPEAFNNLKIGADKFSTILDTLILPSENKKLSVNVVRLKNDIERVRETWSEIEMDVRIIAATKPYVFELKSRVVNISRGFMALEKKYEKATNLLVKNSASAASVALVQRQLLLIERARRNMNSIMTGVDDPLVAKAFQLDVNELINSYQRIANQRVAGSRAAGILRDAGLAHKTLQDNGDYIFYASPALGRIERYSNSITEVSSQLLSASEKLNDGVDELLAEQLYIRIAIALVVLFAIAMITYRRINRRLKLQSSSNAQHQEAILRLLDELADLADGDLTVSATVTEDFTGAIADSINYAIDQLRSLVVSINESSVHVSQSADETRSTAIALSDASTKQAVAITGATDSINEIVSSMDDVANNADESSKVASSSVEIANKGAGAVQNTINGMDKIREQIQKTSKQIKRLGESSQEIGDIISLINDIADQTNILSLNAAIQASMAGDAGRGFAVVADEVQRLAERSGAATRQIEVLVKAIQADTNEAVISMEQTTAEVVQGARLAQDAGVALEEIEEVSNNLAQLIQGISGAAGEQSKAAVDIARTMGLIKEISTQTSSGSQETAGSLGNLAELAKEMRNSVSGFTLPGEEIATAPIENIQPEPAEAVVVAVSDEVEVVIEDSEEKAKQRADSAASAA